MKKFLGFMAVLFVGAIVMSTTVPQCDLASSEAGGVQFPEEFWGTWEREDQSKYDNTITFIGPLFQDSQQHYRWELQRIEDDIYYQKSGSDVSESGYGNGSPGGFYALLIEDKDGRRRLNVYDLPEHYLSDDWVGSIDDWTGIWTQPTKKKKPD
jgi:hypothetical protein